MNFLITRFSNSQWGCTRIVCSPSWKDCGKVFILTNFHRHFILFKFLSPVNVNNKIGSCGFVSQMLPGPLTDLFYPVSIIKVDEVTGEPLRKPNGLCYRCGPGDTGEFVGKIYPDDPTRAFDGYANREASDKKIIRNVFKHGDAFFSSGDLLTLDEFGYAFFKDRTGDTFRWKGENVSTTEVEAAIGSYLEHVSDFEDENYFLSSPPVDEGKKMYSRVQLF